MVAFVTSKKDTDRENHNRLISGSYVVAYAEMSPHSAAQREEKDREHRNRLFWFWANLRFPELYKKIFETVKTLKKDIRVFKNTLDTKLKNENLSFTERLFLQNQRAQLEQFESHTEAFEDALNKPSTLNEKSLRLLEKSVNATRDRFSAFSQYTRDGLKALKNKQFSFRKSPSATSASKHHIIPRTAFASQFSDDFVQAANQARPTVADMKDAYGHSDAKPDDTYPDFKYG